jgi:OmpA-OmpF porin, OOP family
MRIKRIIACSAITLLLLAACKKDEATSAAESAAEMKADTGDATTAEPAASAVETTAATPTAPPADPEFSVTSVAVTSAALPPFPFFKVPEGLVNNYNDKDALIGFDREYFLAGKKLIPVEGKLYRNNMALKNDDSGRQYSALEFHRNYENAITALGGKKISTTQFTDEILKEAGGRDAVEKYWRSVSPVPDYEHYSYLIRTPDKEYWIHIATGAIPTHGYVTVLEKEGMKQSLALLDASAMKRALDTDGHVALYINFDIDKATLRSDSQSVIDEINKLMSGNPDIKLSIEGHTDSTGAADHNRELSTARARSVLGALVGLGVDPARLSSKGFGPDKPIADNANEEGRAKNRRVELVKM